MKKKIVIIATLLIVVIILVLGSKYYINTKRIPDGLSNLIPMYGNTGSIDKRTDRLKTADENFIQSATNNGQISRENASMYYAITGGWGFYFQKDYETSMKRFNETWLLNSDNYQSFWGFGLLLVEQNKFDEAIKMFERSLELYAKKNQNEILKQWYEKEVDKTTLTQQQIEFKDWIGAMYESANSLILCDIGNAYLKKAINTNIISERQLNITKTLELINEATKNKTITKNLEDCYKILDIAQNTK